MAPLEIERKYLLDGPPALPPDAVATGMEQGYLPEGGRVRRAVGADGAVRCTHTIKSGQGLVRQERERQLDAAEFEKMWVRTEGRRLRKTRYTVTEGERVWEVDVYDELDLALAEVELPAADAAAPPPAWLAPHIVREVTDEPEYTNAEIALCIGRGEDDQGGTEDTDVARRKKKNEP